MNIREHFLELLDLKMNLHGATIEEIAAFLEVGPNYLYQIRGKKVQKVPSEKLLKRLEKFTKPTEGASQVNPTSIHEKGPDAQFIRVELKSGNVFHLPVIGPEGYERAVAAAATLERASREVQDLAVLIPEILRELGVARPNAPTPGAGSGPAAKGDDGR